MIADPLTKTMTALRLVITVTTGYFDLRPTESLMIKKKNRELRKMVKEFDRKLD